MSDLFWIIPSIILGVTAVWLLGMWVISVFKNHEWKEILLTVIILTNVLSLLSLGLWMAVQSSFVVQTIGLLIILFVGLAIVSIWTQNINNS